MITRLAGGLSAPKNRGWRAGWVSDMRMVAEALLGGQAMLAIRDGQRHDQRQTNTCSERTTRISQERD